MDGTGIQIVAKMKVSTSGTLHESQVVEDSFCYEVNYSCKLRTEPNGIEPNRKGRARNRRWLDTKRQEAWLDAVVSILVVSIWCVMAGHLRDALRADSQQDGEAGTSDLVMGHLFYGREGERAS